MAVGPPRMVSQPQEGLHACRGRSQRRGRGGQGARRSATSDGLCGECRAGELAPGSARLRPPVHPRTLHSCMHSDAVPTTSFSAFRVPASARLVCCRTFLTGFPNAPPFKHEKAFFHTCCGRLQASPSGASEARAPWDSSSYPRRHSACDPTPLRFPSRPLGHGKPHIPSAMPSCPPTHGSRLLRIPGSR